MRCARAQLQACLATFYVPVVRLIDHVLPPDMRQLILRLLVKVGRAHGYVADR